MTERSGPRSSTHRSSPIGRLVATDLDGDGKTDLVGLRAGYYYSIGGVVVPFLQQPDGSLAIVEAFLAGSGSQGIASADFNEDGIPDFATADTASMTLSVLLGEQEGRLEAGIYLPLQTQPFVLVPGDFDGDGREDIAAIGGSYDGPLQIVQSLNGVASAGPVIELDSNPQGGAAADFNGDGFLDLALTTYFNGVSVRFGNGDGTFQQPTNFTTGNFPRFIVAGDFTGDGVPDLAISEHDNQNRSQITLFVNDGTGQFTAGPPTPISGEISSLVAARLEPGRHARPRRNDLLPEPGRGVRASRQRRRHVPTGRRVPGRISADRADHRRPQRRRGPGPRRGRRGRHDRRDPDEQRRGRIPAPDAGRDRLYPERRRGGGLRHRRQDRHRHREPELLRRSPCSGASAMERSRLP